MCKKQAVVIATAAGGSMKSTVKDMADSLEMWGIAKIYKYGVAVQTSKRFLIGLTIGTFIKKEEK